MRLLYKFAHGILSLLRRGKVTLGVRALLIDNGRVLLVKHTYLPHWYLPGGGINKGENPMKALRRELREEISINLTRDPELLGFYYNDLEKRNDYIAVYVCHHFDGVAKIAPEEFEVEKIGWFELEDLPSTLSPGTQRRIGEFLKTKNYNDKW
ncbi:MAG TPA: NUDIX domain-containing protein [Alphaproteobacteria bacterium]